MAEARTRGLLVLIPLVVGIIGGYYYAYYTLPRVVTETRTVTETVTETVTARIPCVEPRTALAGVLTDFFGAYFPDMRPSIEIEEREKIAVVSDILVDALISESKYVAPNKEVLRYSELGYDISEFKKYLSERVRPGDALLSVAIDGMPTYLAVVGCEGEIRYDPQLHMYPKATVREEERPKRHEAVLTLRVMNWYDQPVIEAELGLVIQTPDGCKIERAQPRFSASKLVPIGWDFRQIGDVDVEPGLSAHERCENIEYRRVATQFEYWSGVAAKYVEGLGVHDSRTLQFTMLADGSLAE